MITKSLTFYFTLLLSLLCFSSYANEYTHDQKSAKIANQTLAAMGGRDNYDQLRFVSWNFFGKRFHIWDKHTGDIRIEFGENLDDVLVMNIHTKQGQWWQQGQLVSDLAELRKKLNWGYRVWINDSYWLVMPFKLHDPGVNLTYAREDKSLTGQPVDVLTMTFNDVGVTPDNKYELFIDKQTQLISEFAFYKTVETEKPRFRMPWANYKAYGEVLLADNRGKNSVAPVNVYQKLGAGVMSSNTPAVDAQGQAIPKTK